MQLSDKLYYYTIKQSEFWEDIEKHSSSDGMFWFDGLKKYNSFSMMARAGEWDMPFEYEITPGYEIPKYDPTFNKPFDQIMDEKALQIRNRIRAGEKFALMYSGGIDSTAILVSLIKNLNAEEFESITLFTSRSAEYENPYFWQKYILNKINIVDSKTVPVSNLVESGFTIITGDNGDSIFGTFVSLEFYVKHGSTFSEKHYSNYADELSNFFAFDNSERGLKCGRMMYEKYDRNIRSVDVPIYTIHDYFWWTIFNLKYTECSIRGSINVNKKMPVKTYLDLVVNWFNDEDYQKWSMVNNNNGQKIKSYISTYKYIIRKYIYDFDKNDWYFYFKDKIASLSNIRSSSYDKTVVGVDSNYNVLRSTDDSVRDYFRNKFANYKSN